MTRHEYLATKFARGAQDAPPRTRWWPRHWVALSRVVSHGHGPGRDAASRALVHEASEWIEILGRERESALFVEHVSLEDGLVAAACRRDSGEIDRLDRALIANARDQARVHALRMEGFPEARYRRLLEEHVSLLAGALRWTLEADRTRYDENDAKGRANAIALADFAAEWL